MEKNDRRAIARAAILLATSSSENVRNQAFRILVQRFNYNPRHDELEVEQAQLHADARRELAALLPQDKAA